MTQRLFKRSCAITIAKPQSFFIQAPNAIVVRDLRVVFQIEKNLGKDPNTCKVQIYNLAARTRGEVQAKPLHIRVDAGYDGDVARLFTGDLRFAQSKKLPVDWETTLEVADGDRAHRFARVNRSFKAGVDTKTAIAEVVKSMGLKVPKTVTEARELAAQFTNGLSLQGPSAGELEKLLKPHGFSHSIQDGRLQILKGDAAHPTSAIRIAQDNGMVGSPEFGAPEKKTGKRILTVKSLLQPDVFPGGLISVESQSINGVFRCEKVTHNGDTHGVDWYTTIEAKQV